MKQKKKNVGKQKKGDAIADFAIFRERTSDFSLKYWAIQSSKVFGARRKTVLRGEGSAWAPVSWSFDKLREVGDLSYLGFTLYLSVL